MNTLLKYVDEYTLNNMLEINPSIKDLSGEKLEKMIYLLKELNCSIDIVTNIISSNPDYLSREIKDVLALVAKLNTLGLKRLDITFDTNPWLLNKNAYEIDEFISDKLNSKMAMDDIIDLIDSGKID